MYKYMSYEFVPICIEKPAVLSCTYLCSYIVVIKLNVVKEYIRTLVLWK